MKFANAWIMQATQHFKIFRNEALERHVAPNAGEIIGHT